MAESNDSVDYIPPEQPASYMPHLNSEEVNNTHYSSNDIMEMVKEIEDLQGKKTEYVETIQKLTEDKKNLKREVQEKDNLLQERIRKMEEMVAQNKSNNETSDIQQLQLGLGELELTSIRGLRDETAVYVPQLQEALALVKNNQQLLSEMKEKTAEHHTTLKAMNDKNDRESVHKLIEEINKLKSQSTKENAISSDHSQYQDRIKELEEELKNTKLILASTSNDNQLLQQNVNTAREEEIQSEVKELKEQLTDVCNQRQSALNDIIMLKKNCASFKAENDSLKKRLQEEEDKYSKISHQLKDFESSTNENQTELNKEIKKLKASSEEANTREVELKSKISRMESDKNILNDEVKDANEKLKALSEEHTKLKLNHSEIQEQLLEMEREHKDVLLSIETKQKVTAEEMQKSSVKAQTEILESQSQLAAIRRDRDAVKSQLHDTTVLLERTRQEVSAKEQEMKHIKAECEKQTEQDDEIILELKKKMEIYERDISTLHNNLTTEISLRATLQKKHKDVLEQYNNVAVAAQKMETSKNNEIKKWKDDCAKLNIRLLQSCDEKDNLTAQLLAAEEVVQSDRAKDKKAERATLQELQRSQQHIQQLQKEASEHIGLLKAQADGYKQDFEEERAAREKAQERIESLTEENLKLQERLDEVAQNNFQQMRLRHGSHINTLGQTHREGDLQLNLDLTGGAAAQEPNFPHGQDEDRAPQSLLPEFLCPKCNEPFPDYESLTFHVETCLNLTNN